MAVRLLVTLVLAFGAWSAVASTPKPGDVAPKFSLPNAAGETVAIADFAGKSKLVLVFYRGYW